MKDYKEATAVKTGYTRAAGFNGVMIAEKRKKDSLLPRQPKQYPRTW